MFAVSMKTTDHAVTLQLHIVAGFRGFPPVSPFLRPGNLDVRYPSSPTWWIQDGPTTLWSWASSFIGTGPLGCSKGSHRTWSTNHKPISIAPLQGRSNNIPLNGRGGIWLEHIITITAEIYPRWIWFWHHMNSRPKVLEVGEMWLNALNGVNAMKAVNSWPTSLTQS